GWKLHLRNLTKVIVRAAYLVREAQRYAAKTLAHWLQEKWTLAGGQDDARKSDDVLAGHRISDHRERFLPDLLSRHDVVWLFEISRVYLSHRQETLDLDGSRVLRTGSRDLLLFVFLIGGIVGDLFLVRLVQTRGDRRRACAAGRFHEGDRAWRRALAARSLKVSVLDQQKLVLANLVARALFDESTASPVRESTSLCLRRWPVRR